MYADFLFPNGVNRMWFVTNGYVQDEHGNWVRREELERISNSSTVSNQTPSQVSEEQPR